MYDNCSEEFVNLRVCNKLAVKRIVGNQIDIESNNPSFGSRVNVGVKGSVLIEDDLIVKGNIISNDESSKNNQLTNSISIGIQAGQQNQSTGSIAIGFRSFVQRQGQNSIAIGSNIGATHNNVIVINGSNTVLNSNIENALFIKPIRSQENKTANLCWDYDSGEIIAIKKTPCDDIINKFTVIKCIADQELQQIQNDGSLSCVPEGALVFNKDQKRLEMVLIEGQGNDAKKVLVPLPLTGNYEYYDP